MKIMPTTVISLVSIGFLVCADTSEAITLGFTRVTSNSAVDISDDLTLEVMNGGPSTVQFSFSKGNMYDGFITQIYFEDSNGLLSSIGFSAGLSTPEVVYDSPATPGHPPGVNPFDTDFSFDPNNPQPKNGISAGEIGTFIGTFESPADFDDLKDAIEEGEFRVALHAQGLLNDESDSFVTELIPEPGVSILSAVAFLILLTRRVRT